MRTGDDTSDESMDHDNDNANWFSNAKHFARKAFEQKSTEEKASSPIQTSFISSKNSLFAKSRPEEKQTGSAQSFANAFKNVATSSTQSSKPKKNESLKDRLFKSLKTLKKKSEMRTTGSSPNFGFLKKPQKPTSLKLQSDTSSCSGGDLTPSPAASTPSNSNFFGSSRLNTPDSDYKADQSLSNYDDDTETESTDEEISTIYENAINRNRSPVLRTNRELVQPTYVVRPAPLDVDIYESDEDDDEPEREEDDESSEEETERRQQMRRIFYKFRRKRRKNLALERDAILPILQKLDRKDIMNCMLVCRLWNSWTMDPSLWEELDISGHRVNSNVLLGIVRRQPLALNLSWTNINHRQMTWLIARLPRLQSLSLAGCNMATVPAISTCNCPLLRVLDLSHIDGLNDELMKELSSAPTDLRPGLHETKTRLRRLTHLNLSHTLVTDVTLRLISHHFPEVTSIDLSGCQNVSDVGIAILGAAKSTKLVELKVSGCSCISDTSLDTLKKCQRLALVDLRDCDAVTTSACQKFVSTKNKLILKQNKLIEARA